MKKIILFVLCFITLINFSSSAFASSKKPSDDKLRSMFGGAFCYLVENRKNESKEVSQKKQKAVALLTTGCIHDRDLVLQVYNEKEAECRSGIKMFKMKKNQAKVEVMEEYLTEISDIAKIIGLKK